MKTTTTTVVHFSADDIKALILNRIPGNRRQVELCLEIEGQPAPVFWERVQSVTARLVTEEDKPVAVKTVR